MAEGAGLSEHVASEEFEILVANDLLGEQAVIDDARPPAEWGEHGEEGDGMALMQLQWADQFTGHLHALLAEFEGMSTGRAGSAAAFLQSMLQDLRHPTLIERQNRLDALVSVFAGDDSHLDEETRIWCLLKWKVLQPLLEGRVQPGAVPERKTKMPVYARKNHVQARSLKLLRTARISQLKMEVACR